MLYSCIQLMLIDVIISILTNTHLVAGIKCNCSILLVAHLAVFISPNSSKRSLFHCNFLTEAAISYVNSLCLIFFISIAPSKELTVKCMLSHHPLCHKRGEEIWGVIFILCVTVCVGSVCECQKEGRFGEGDEGQSQSIFPFFESTSSSSFVRLSYKCMSVKAL